MSSGEVFSQTDEAPGHSGDALADVSLLLSGDHDGTLPIPLYDSSLDPFTLDYASFSSIFERGLLSSLSATQWELPAVQPASLPSLYLAAVLLSPNAALMLTSSAATAHSATLPQDTLRADADNIVG